jgi:peroxiredoxin
MTIKVGDRLPDTTFRVMTPDGPADRSTSEIFGGRKVVLFGVPGAFTPTCHKNHLPGFIENAEAIKAKGADEIAVVSVNDVWVMKAWREATGAEGKITFLADGAAQFANAIGLVYDGPMGRRLRRFSMIVDNGVVSWMAIEETPGKADLTSATELMARL